MKLAVAAFAAAAAVVSADQWDPLRQGLDAWVALNLDLKFGLTIGTPAGRDFYYQTSDGWNMLTPIDGASFSKWTTTMMIANMVDAGILSFDDLASKHLPFWTTDPADVRSEVTLASLLSLTSGFQTDPDNIYRCPVTKTYVECAEDAYNATKGYVKPRTTWTYLSCHHQFAGAMAVAASGGKDIQTLLSQYLYKPFNMTHSVYQGGHYPMMAGAIVTNGQDTEQFLKKMLDYTGAPKSVLDVVETDWTQPPVDLYPRRNYFGHYGLGHMWECFEYDQADPQKPQPVSPMCAQSQIHAGPGDYGNYPAIDRSTGGGEAGPVRPSHYWGLHIMENLAVSGIPEYLRIVAKPVSDLILNGTDPTTVPNQQLLNQGGGILRRDIDYIKGELVDCTCTGAPTSKTEPWDSLYEGLPADDESKYRLDILKAGGGKSLMDIVAIQKKLGTCTCSGRK